MVPVWLRLLSIGFVVAGVVSAVIVAADLTRHRQKMWIMDIVWPLTALYAGPFGVWAYSAIGRNTPRRNGKDKPFWQTVLTGATHCGAGCAIGDFIGEWIVFAAALSLLGSTLIAKYVVAFGLAYVFGIFFQYFSIAPIRGLGLADGIYAAVKADTLSLVAYEIGMFAWMGIVQKLLFPGLEPVNWAFWFMMQIAMMLGLATTFPMNWLLIRTASRKRCSDVPGPPCRLLYDNRRDVQMTTGQMPTGPRPAREPARSRGLPGCGRAFRARSTASRSSAQTRLR